MAELAIDDPFEARRKAASRLGLEHSRVLPDGEEILSSLRDYLAIFQGDALAQRLVKLRTVARDLMRGIAPLAEARLVGPVLEGTASDASPVTLHLLGITGEDLAIHLLEQGVAYRELTFQVSYGPRDQRALSAFRIAQGGCEVVLLAFPPDAPRQAPLDPVTGRAQRRASLAALEKLLGDRDACGPDAGRSARG